TIRNGRRCSGAVAYLRPAMPRRNLDVAIGTLATRITMSGGRATGVVWRRHDEAGTARAAREVIVAGGVINSPQLLMLSGIGDPDELDRVGITTLVDLPGVGCNLSDHVSANIDYSRPEGGTMHRTMRADRIA